MKKALSLALVLLMLLSVALVSCKKEEAPPTEPKPLDTYSYFDKFTLAESEFSPEKVVLTDNLAPNPDYTSRQDYHLSSMVYRYTTGNYDNDLNLVSNTHEYVFTEGGIKQAFTEYTDPDSLPESERDSAIVAVATAPYYNSVGDYLVITLEHGSGKYSHTMYNIYGNIIASVSDVDYSSPSYYIYSSRVLYFCGNAYSFDKETQQTYLVRENTTEDFAYNLSTFTYDKDASLYTKINGTEITIYNDNLERVGYINCEKELNSSYDIIQLTATTFVLVVDYKLPDDASDYDYYSSGKREIKASIFNANTGEVTDAGELTYYGQLSSVLLGNGDTCKDSAVACLMLNPCDLATSEYYTSKMLALDANLKPLYFVEYPAGMTCTQLENGAWVFTNGVETYIGDASTGNKTASLPYGISHNERWFYDDKAIYDSKMTLIYDYLGANREIYEVYERTIMFEETLTIGEDEVTRYVLWRGAGDEIILSSDDASVTYHLRDELYYKKSRNGDVFPLETYELYNYDGEPLKRIENVSSISFNGEGITVNVYSADTDTTTREEYYITSAPINN